MFIDIKLYKAFFDYTINLFEIGLGSSKQVKKWGHGEYFSNALLQIDPRNGREDIQVSLIDTILCYEHFLHFQRDGQGYWIINTHSVDLLTQLDIYGPDNSLGIPYEEICRDYILNLFRLFDRVEIPRSLDDLSTSSDISRRIEFLDKQQQNILNVAKYISSKYPGTTTEQEVIAIYQKTYTIKQ